MMFAFRAVLAGPLVAAVLLASPAVVLAQNKPPKLVAPKEDPNRIYDAVSEPAIPIGGLELYGQYLSDHLTYPTGALQRKVQGTDSVAFVIEKNGTISNVVISKGFDPECDAEALRVIKAGPKWSPARHRGQVVRQRTVVPVTFALPAEPAGANAAAPNTSSAPATPSTAAPAASNATTAGSTTPNGLKMIQPESGAQPPGGTDAFFAWIKQNMQYPELARRGRQEGKIRVEFMVEADGSLSNTKLLNRLGFGLDEEALRLIKTAPKWQPAMYQGKPIRQKMVLPIIFQL